MPPKPKPASERFHDKYIPEPNTGCWLWLGYVDDKDYALGYGTIAEASGSRRLYAHRLSYEMFRGPLKSGDHVCHTCDMPPCVNSDHLFVGTNDENRADSVRKGRTARGIRSGTAKLSEDDVRKILSDRRKLQDIADDFKISLEIVRAIKLRRLWRHIQVDDAEVYARKRGYGAYRPKKK